MAYQYIFDPIAADEYEEAFKWYEQRNIVAADNLILAVQEAIIAICLSCLNRYPVQRNSVALKKRFIWQVP